MFKPTRVKQVVAGLLALFAGEELAVIDVDAAEPGSGLTHDNGSQVFNVEKAPSTQNLEDFMAKHHLSIDKAAFKDHDMGAGIGAPLPTPKAAMQMAAKNVGAKLG